MGEKHAIFGGHVHRSWKNVIVEKKERGKEREQSGGKAPFLLCARSRIDGKRVRKQFTESSCLASETAFVARRPRHVLAAVFAFAFRAFKKASTRASTGVIHAVNRRCAAHAFRTLGASEHLEIRDSVSKRVTKITKITKNIYFFFFGQNYVRGLASK